MLRLAEGNLDGDDGTRGHTAEIAEMQRAIAVFRGGMLERSRLNRETRLLSELTNGCNRATRCRNSMKWSRNSCRG